MGVSDALHVVQVRVSQISADRAQLEIVADYEDAKKREREPAYNNLEELYAWNSTMGHDAPVEAWPLMPYTRTRTVGGRTLDRHILKTEIPLERARDLEVAIIAKTNVGGWDIAQEHNDNFKPGYRHDPTRDYDGRFARVDDNVRVKDVASFRSRSRDLVAQLGDRTVGELRLLFGGRSVTQIRSMKPAARAAVIALAFGGAGAGEVAVLGSVLGAV
jgi:hypothetical protein